MTIKIILNDSGNPPGKLADAELHFGITTNRQALESRAAQYEALGDSDSLAVADAIRDSLTLDGLKLIGFAVWERKTGGGRNVTFPARTYSVQGERRSFALLRPAYDPTGNDNSAGLAAQATVRDLILAAYDAHVKETV